MNSLPATGYAFPVSTIDGFTQHGLTKREAFAIQVLASLVAKGKPHQHETIEQADKCKRGLAFSACAYADALLAELAKPDPMTQEQQAEQAGSRA